MFLLLDADEHLIERIESLIPTIRVEKIIAFDEAIHLRRRDGSEWRLSQPEPLCIGIATNDSSGQIINNICKWWKDQADENISICDIKDGDGKCTFEANLLKWIVYRFIYFIDTISCGNRDLLRQNSQLRQSYGALQSTFSQLEINIARNQLNIPIKQYDTQEIKGFYTPDNDNVRITQVLPVLSSKLSYLELSLCPAIKAMDGELTITLRIEPTGIVIAQWNISYANVKSGWNGFSCPAVVGDLNEVVMECRWSATDGAPAIGLSAAHWDIPYGAVPTSTGDQTMTLAMRIWSALPGVRPPSLVIPNQATEASDITILALPPSELAHASQYEVAETIKREYPSVSYIDNLARLRVHPHGAATTIAKLPSALPEGTRCISADARTINAEGPDIEYALIATSPDVLPEAFLTAIKGPAIGFSGWHRLKAKDVARLTAFLDPPAGTQHHLFFATRLPAGEAEAGAWATWGGLEIELKRTVGNSFRETVSEDEFLDVASTRPVSGETGVVPQPPAGYEAASDTRAEDRYALTHQIDSLRVALKPEELAKAEQFATFSALQYDYPSVQFLDNLEALLVHPHLGTQTIARLHLPEGVIIVSACCKTIMADAAPISYAMAIGPAVISEDEIIPLENHPRDGFSGWRTIEPTVEERLTLTLMHPAKAGQYLYLCTRLNRDFWETHAWATWSDIQFELMGQVAMEVVAPPAAL